MWHRIIDIAVGLLIGAALGAVCAFVVAPSTSESSESGWVSYPTLASVSQPGQEWQEPSALPFRFWLFLGLLLGGGFGATTGAVISIGLRSGREAQAVTRE